MATTCDEVCEYCADVLAMCRSDLLHSRSFERMAELCSMDHIEVDMASTLGFDPPLSEPSIRIDADNRKLVFTDVTTMFHGVADYLRRLPPPGLCMASVIDRAIRAMELAVHGDDVVHVISKMREVTV
jgi:hypothetical protein